VFDGLGRQAAERRHLLRCTIRQDLIRQLLKPANIGGDKTLVSQPLPHHDVHHAQGQGAVAARADDKGLIDSVTGGSAVGVDGPDPSPALTGRLGVAHGVDTGGSRIDAPQNHQIALLHARRIHGRSLAHDLLPAGILGR